MKSRAQKENIREMLRAESPGDTQSPWGDFKRKLSDEFLSTKIPPLEITTPPRNKVRWLVPAFTVFLIAVGIFFWRTQSGTEANTMLARSGSQGAVREFKKGDVFTSERREIRFLKGSAAMTQEAERIRIDTTALTADFRLQQKVDMQIRHPLITVTITGTRFIFDATAKAGIIRLSEGSLAIQFHGAAGKPDNISLKAPAEFTFSDRKYRSSDVRPILPSGDKLLYRYDLVNGESFFAHQLKIDSKIHRVHLLGGSEQIIPVENIVRVVPAENR